MPKKQPKKKKNNKEQVRPSVQKDLMLPIAISILLSIGAIIVAFSVLGEKEQYEDVDKSTIGNLEVEEVAQELDQEKIKSILEGGVHEFVQSADGFGIDVVSIITGARTRVTAHDEPGLELFAVPDDYDGRIFLTYSSDEKSEFEVFVLDLTKPGDTQAVDIELSDVEELNFLSPGQRYVATVKDGYISREFREFIVFNDLLGKRKSSSVIKAFDERISSRDISERDRENIASSISIEWVSDECLKFSVYDGLESEPRPQIREETACVLDGLGL